ncbi:MFS transporter [Streptomyces sp. DSM 42041]|uniref:MFS transporter n=1 Tax=Streptomyces hazeniae TaxID=3075538 RepID=A0ABU2NUY4_9ACTN|nr:MFS transporter [Streptomyces sp. DSM 42041]MDT0380775.1 MFS transporter [Streptomyces sp. DSM 42041]
MRVFNLVWAGQAASMIGTAMTVFGLGVWVFLETGSPTAFTTLVMAGSLPGLLMLPFAGVLVDRWDRRRVMLVSDLGTAVLPLAVLALLSAGALELWHLYPLVAAASACKAFQWPAFSSLVSQVVGKDDLSKANARVGLAEAGGLVLGDLLAGALYGVVGLEGLLLVDLATFGLAGTATLASFRLLPPLPPARTGGDRRGPRALGEEMAEGLRFIRQRPGLLGLLVFFAANNLLMEMSLVLVAPLILGAHAPSALGVVNAVGAVGMIVVSALLSVVRLPRGLVRTVFAVTLLHGCLLLLMGAHPALWMLGLGLFGILGGYAVTNAVTPTLWQRKTPTEIQGRVFAVRRMIAWSAEPVAYGLAGPLALHVGGPLAGAAPWETATGTGAGIAMILLLAGPLLLVVAALAYARPRVRHLERELPDVARAEPAAT